MSWSWEKIGWWRYCCGNIIQAAVGVLYNLVSTAGQLGIIL